ncbi:putative Hpc2-related domain-containing protein [Seiridium cardinale]|uniref:Hpc2-related domain-containing protein n=1 Tax=Seiridium cardinale TaxID=138064 RepID=A0ABR2XL48_9PEZI
MTSTRDVSMRYSSSPELSDPPSGLSETTSPTQYGASRTRPAAELDEIIVDHSAYRFDVSGQPVLTKDGVPRRKPGPKPGTKLGKRNSTNNNIPDGSETPKTRKPRKPRDPNAPPIQRKRKLATAEPETSESHIEVRSASIGAGPPRQTKLTEMATPVGRLEPMAQPLKRESSSGQPRMSNMSVLLNSDPEPQPQPQSQPPPQPQTQQQPPPNSAPPRSSGTNYDPIRPSYDPVRGTMVSHSYSNPLASPRAPTNVINRASASPSIASLVDPPVQSIISPIPTHTTFAQSAVQQSQPRQEPVSVPASPQPFRTPKEFAPPPAPKPTPPESAKQAIPTVTRAQIEIRPQSITSIAAASKRTPPKNHSHGSGSPSLGAQKNGLELPGDERSILDFGKSGSEVVTPSIVLHIPLNGENNKYVNFMRVAEERYGWDALHPRQAEARARKARIAAASAALAQQDSGREGDEMSVDESDNDDSNVEMGGTSGPDKPDGKIKKKKRHFKEDEYDKEDDFVDDSEMLWEEQAAASRDGFFVYSGPLVPEVEKPEPGRGEGRPARGRGSRGGRGGSGRGTGTGRGRGGGPGSRGGVVRKPRMTKADKAQMDREKAEREAAFLKSTNGGGNYNVLHPASPQFAGL